ncbi:MAG: hypothetical protein FWF15_06430, partial [Oscillospiraceae bacterium]|nr:hypothetical protein [Oscillospiraceae bacterium]
ERAMLMKKRQTLNVISMNASQKDPRLTHAEIKMHTTGGIRRSRDFDPIFIKEELMITDRRIYLLN